MSKEKHIEEMAEDLCACHTEFATGVGEIYTDYDATAQKMAAKGYRKQSEGEWEGNGHLKHCSVCGNVVNFNNVSSWLYNYCPNCGAKMKGGAE